MHRSLIALAGCSLALLAAAGTAPGQAPGQPPTSSPARTDSAPSPLAGAYTLVTVDGRPTPATITHPGAPPDAAVLAATLIVRPDGSFLQAMAYRATMAGEQRFMARPFTGRISPDGGAFVARWDGAGMTPVTMAHDTLVVHNEGTRFAYVKARR